MKVVREGAESVERVERIPALLEFQTLPLDSLAVQQIGDVDGQWHDRESSVLSCIGEQNINAEKVHRQYRVHHLKSLAIH